MKSGSRAAVLRYVPVTLVAVMASVTAVYALVWHPARDPDFTIQAFAREARVFTEPAPKLFIFGPDVAALEFYAGRKPEYPGTLGEAWLHAGPDDVILLSGNRKRPIDRETLAYKPLVEMKSRKAEFMAFRKAGASP